MDLQTDMLDLMTEPLFLVRGGIIVRVNQAAARLLIREGASIDDCILTGHEEYQAFAAGCLYITLRISGEPWGASVQRTEQGDLFSVDQLIENPELRVLALAARELRSPLGDAMIQASQIGFLSDNPAMTEAIEKLNRKLYQLQRQIGNMSDVSGISAGRRTEPTKIDALFREIFEKAAVLAEGTGKTLTYEGLSADVEISADRQQLERAALNMLSNAMKFTQPGGAITGRLIRDRQRLMLQVSDDGSGIPEEILGTVFRRYLRQPAIEESRQGLGLGMLLIRAAAAAHGGAVLIDRPGKTGTRVTMTMTIQEPEKSTLRADRLRVDYAGERDHTLIELSDVLPPECYQI